MSRATPSSTCSRALVFGKALDALQHHPGIRLTDAADDLRRRKVDERGLLRLLIDPDLAGIVLDAVGGHPTCYLHEMLEREKRMPGEVVAEPNGWCGNALLPSAASSISELIRHSLRQGFAALRQRSSIPLSARRL
jgi:hypothetical protein